LFKLTALLSRDGQMLIFFQLDLAGVQVAKNQVVHNQLNVFKTE